MFEFITTAITANNAPYVPKLQVIKKCVMSNTNLTNEQLIDVAGGF